MISLPQRLSNFLKQTYKLDDCLPNYTYYDDHTTMVKSSHR